MRLFLLICAHRAIAQQKVKNMDTTSFVYQDFADSLQNVLQSARPQPTEPCSICSYAYTPTSAANIRNPSETLEAFANLPCAQRAHLDDQLKTPVYTPCGHHFCLYCLCRWLATSQTCPFCRTPIPVPSQQSTNTVLPSPEGLTLPHPTADISLRIGEWSVRQVLTSDVPANASFPWRREYMVADLPKIMIQVARRFYYQARRQIPQDVAFLKPHRPFEFLGGRIQITLQGIYWADAPVSMTEDAAQVYRVLSDRISGRHDYLATAFNREEYCCCWVDMAGWLLDEVNMEVPNATGGVGSIRWRRFVRLVIVYLLKWQYHCDRVTRAIY
ncbi:hypothetical protein K505DRAFT_359642 [Melanomma pulvis-pyrius CBS 109.77]|uniref:RING-type domain-containing protein n=1 Tax=Melanomma pulvis-pyrius CBS 109.77 TaxID=1314802 RepID=A0A6A6XII5_9PLEO|nr:hypothetical protein K505DRAFT_359642 [Melanomma pulvis-pyrius CBS 109.77]